MNANCVMHTNNIETYVHAFHAEKSLKVSGFVGISLSIDLSKMLGHTFL